MNFLFDLCGKKYSVNQCLPVVAIAKAGKSVSNYLVAAKGRAVLIRVFEIRLGQNRHFAGSQQS